MIRSDMTLLTRHRKPEVITQDIISRHRTHLIAKSCDRLDKLDVPDIVHVGPHQAGEDGPAGLSLTAGLTEGLTGGTGERSPPSLAGVSGPGEDLEENDRRDNICSEQQLQYIERPPQKFRKSTKSYNFFDIEKRE